MKLWAGVSLLLVGHWDCWMKTNFWTDSVEIETLQRFLPVQQREKSNKCLTNFPHKNMRWFRTMLFIRQSKLKLRKWSKSFQSLVHCQTKDCLLGIGCLWTHYHAYSSAFNTNTSGDIIIGEKATYLRSRKHRGEQKFGKKVLNSTF